MKPAPLSSSKLSKFLTANSIRPCIVSTADPPFLRVKEVSESPYIRVYNIAEPQPAPINFTIYYFISTTNKWSDVYGDFGNTSAVYFATASFNSDPNAPPALSFQWGTRPVDSSKWYISTDYYEDDNTTSGTIYAYPFDVSTTPFLGDQLQIKFYDPIFENPPMYFYYQNTSQPQFLGFSRPEIYSIKASDIPGFYKVDVNVVRGHY